MKKYLAIFGAAILVMAMAAPAMAQFTSWGHMEIQTVYERTPNFNTQSGIYAIPSLPAGSVKGDLLVRQMAERFRFYLQYGDPKTVRAVIGFEADSTDWGELRPTNTTPSPTGGKMGGWTADSVQLEIKHAYLDFVIPNTPVTITAGIQPFVYGGRLIIANDGTGITAKANFAPHTLALAWARINDQDRFTYTVQDLYILDWRMVQQQFDLNVYGLYLNDLYDGQQATYTPATDAASIPIANKFNQNVYGGGVAAGFRPGNFEFFAQGVYLLGKRKYTQITSGSPSDQDYSAYAAEIMAKYKIGPGMAIIGEGFYASGNDADSADLKYYPVQKGSEGRSIFGNDRTVFFWMNAAQMGYYHNNQIDFSGMWYGRAAFEYSPTAWVRFILNYLYIGDTSKGAPGTFRPGFTSQAAGSPTYPKIVNSPKGSRQDKDEDFIGHEINLITTLNIYKNFVYNIGIYYFLPGSVFDTPTKDADPSYGLNTKLNYAF